MSWREPADSCAEFTELLDELGVTHVVAGALAALRYRAEPRFTTDVDFLVRPRAGLADALRARGYDVETMSEPGEEPYLLFVRGGGTRVDLIVAETAYQDEAMDRARDGYLAPEDVIVHKLIAWRPRDRDDVSSILSTGIALDVQYIERWAEAWGVADRWDQARRR